MYFKEDEPTGVLITIPLPDSTYQGGYWYLELNFMLKVGHLFGNIKLLTYLCKVKQD